ncbi:hypothetical protein NC653_024594 [Populus alba x Populus x berolinensis]|uniref:Uncharacterized protein n=1 Tax=Populus alba x Populus x berolinensis TaxID=444605 RepID=A0AAD6M972_9ROSI|nr:hypothetical protein NC653_024594 [Populus alba x Populus x berolinensis]
MAARVEGTLSRSIRPWSIFLSLKRIYLYLDVDLHVSIFGTHGHEQPHTERRQDIYSLCQRMRTK